jgi:hypothetical protein
VSGTQTVAATPLPGGGVINNLQIRLAGNPGTGNSYAFTMVRNGSVIPGFTCTISDAAVACNDTDTTVWAAGDTISLQSVPNSNPTARTATWSVTLG